ncbi:MAG: hypothetical protein ACP5T2_05350 [Thermoprotei archaeon]
MDSPLGLVMALCGSGRVGTPELAYGAIKPARYAGRRLSFKQEAPSRRGYFIQETASGAAGEKGIATWEARGLGRKGRGCLKARPASRIR